MKKVCNTKLAGLVPEGSGNQRKTKTRGGGHQHRGDEV